MPVKQRLIEFLKYKKIGQKKFAQSIGMSYGYVNAIRRSIQPDTLHKIAMQYPELNIGWLITGDGPMLKRDTLVALPAKGGEDGIPLIPIEAMAGYGAGDMSVLEYECERFVIPVFKDAEFLISVRGSSMYPKYNSGDIVACKWLPIDTFFQWNKVYVLSTSQGALIKRVDKSEKPDHLLIVSDNIKYPPFNLHRSEIRSLAIVIGVIRLE